MRSRSTAVAATLAALGLGACQPAEAPSVTYARDVKPILDRSCTGCHSADNIGPFPLTTYDEVFEVRELVKAAVETGTMPPWLAGPGCDDYEYDPRLSEEEIATIARWIDEGAHQGEGEPSPVEQGVNEDFSLDRVDLTVPMPVEYEPPPQSSDDYRCFVVDWPEDTTRFVTGFQVRPGNKAIVHHVIAYVAPPEAAAEVEQLDAAEAGPGYTCFGGPGFSGFPRWLGAWAPGGRGSLYPLGTGLRVEPGSKVVLQMHYFVKGVEGQRDQTEIDLKLEDTVDKEAFILPFTNPLWLDDQNMLIPAGQANVSHAWSVRVGDFFEEPFVIHTANLHMHRLGTKAVTWIERAEDQEIDCMLDIPRWDFDWQMSYLLTEPKVVYPDDYLGIECQYDNSAANQPVIDGERQEPRDVAWGEGTGDEMCLGVFYVSSL